MVFRRVELCCGDGLGRKGQDRSRLESADLAQRQAEARQNRVQRGRRIERIPGQPTAQAGRGGRNVTACRLPRRPLWQKQGDHADARADAKIDCNAKEIILRPFQRKAQHAGILHLVPETQGKRPVLLILARQFLIEATQDRIQKRCCHRGIGARESAGPHLGRAHLTDDLRLDQPGDQRPVQLDGPAPGLGPVEQDQQAVISQRGCDRLRGDLALFDRDDRKGQIEQRVRRFGQRETHRLGRGHGARIKPFPPEAGFLVDDRIRPRLCHARCHSLRCPAVIRLAEKRLPDCYREQDCQRYHCAAIRAETGRVTRKAVPLWPGR